MRRIISLIVMSCLLISLLPMFVYSEEDYTVIVDSIDTENNGEVTIKGHIEPSTLIEVPLSLTIMDESGEKILEHNIITNNDGSFQNSFSLAPDERGEKYKYHIGTNYGGKISRIPVKTDDFSKGLSGYMVSSPSSVDIGNPAPSARLANAGDRILFNANNKVTINSGTYEISADIMFKGYTNDVIFISSNYTMDSSNIDSAINKSGSPRVYEFKAFSNGRIEVSCAGSDSNQQIKSYFVGNYNLNEWFNLKAVIDLDTLDLKVYFNQSQVLENENLYILAQKSYNRLFDTFKTNGTERYIDNLSINLIEEKEIVDTNPADGTFFVSGKEYVIFMDKAEIADHMLYVNGHVEPAVEYGIDISVFGEDEICSDEIFTDSDGTFSLEKEMPVVNEDVTYTVSAKPYTPPIMKSTLLDETFSGSANSYLVYNEVTLDEVSGNDVPSIKVSKEEGESRPRILFSASELSKAPSSGMLKISADIMKKERSASNKIYGVTDATGNVNAFTVVSTDTKYSAVVNGKFGSVTIDLVDNYELDRWYKFEANIDLETKNAEFYCDGEKKGDAVISQAVLDFGRCFDTESGSGVHWLDNINVVFGRSNALSVASDKKLVVNYGDTKINNVLTEMSNAKSGTEMMRICKDNAGVLGINIDEMDDVDNEEAAYSFMTGLTYNSISQIKSSFKKAVAIEVFKEANADKSKIKSELSKRLADITNDFKYVNSTSEIFATLLQNDIKEIKNTEELENMIKLEEICSNIADSTKLSVTAVIDRYADFLCEKYGLSSKYVTTENRVNVAISVLNLDFKTDSSENMINQIVTQLNKSIPENNSNSTTEESGRKGSSSKNSGSVIGFTASELKKDKTQEDNLVFADVSNSFWASKQIKFIAEKKIVSGKGNSMFYPNDKVTREEFTKMIILSLKPDLIKYSGGFDDVAEGEWYADYISTAKEQGIIVGESKNIFGVSKEIKREDVAVIVKRLLDNLGYEVDTLSKRQKFDDSDEISEYAKESVLYLSDIGILNGDDSNRFNPSSSLSRAEAATIIYNLFNRGILSNSVYAESNVNYKDIVSAFGVAIDSESAYISASGFADAYARLTNVENLYSVSPTDYLREIGAYASDKEDNDGVTLNEALIAELHALKYTEYLDNLDIYNVAKSAKLLTGVTALKNDYLTAEQCYRLFYNLFNAQVCDDDYNLETKQLRFSDKTFLEYYHDGFAEEGVILATDITALTNDSKHMVKDSVYINGKHIYVGDTDIENYLGYTVKVYGTKNDNDDYVASYFYISNKTKTKELHGYDIDYAKGFNNSDSLKERTNPYVMDKNGKKLLFSDNCNIIYNSYNCTFMNNDDFLKDTAYYIFIDRDGDGKYDVVRVEDYELYIVSAVDIMNGTISTKDSGDIINLNNYENIKIYRGGRRIDKESISVDDCICLYSKPSDRFGISQNTENAQIQIISNVVKEKVEAVKSVGDSKEIKINGVFYHLADNFVGDVKTGYTYTVYYDPYDNIVRMEYAEKNQAYSYFLSYNIDEGSETTYIRLLDMKNNRNIVELTDNVIYTGFDANGKWVTEKKYKKSEFNTILREQFDKRQIVKFSKNSEGIMKIVTAEDMSSNKNYCGYDTDRFTMETVIQKSNAGLLRTSGSLTLTYRVDSSTAILIDDVSDELNTKFIAYTTGGANSLVVPSMFMSNGYVYDATENLVAGLVVMKTDLSGGKNLTSGPDLVQGNAIIVTSISEAIYNEESTYQIKGYQNGKLVEYYTETLDTGVKYKNAWTAYTTKTKVSELSCGDIIIPCMENSSEIVTSIFVIHEAKNQDAEHYMTYWGGDASSSTSGFSTAFSKILYNYNNKILRLKVNEDVLFKVQGTVYIYDSDTNKVSLGSVGTAMYDSTTGNADKVFLGITNTYTTKFMVIYR